MKSFIHSKYLKEIKLYSIGWDSKMTVKRETWCSCSSRNEGYRKIIAAVTQDMREAYMATTDLQVGFKLRQF
jgi:hypothetical protein